MSRLRRRHKRLARELARELRIRHGDDQAKFEQAMWSHRRVRSFDPAMILLLIQFAVALWKFWQSRNISEPSVVASQEELEVLGDDYFFEESEGE
jgi:hypothetical protein